jgi:hypothetical protein
VPVETLQIAVTKGTPTPAASSMESVAGFSTSAAVSTITWLGMGAVAANAEIARGSEHFQSQPFRGTADHDAGKIAARGSGKHGIWHLAGRGLDVGPVHSRRLYCHDDFIALTRENPFLHCRGHRSGVGRLRIQTNGLRREPLGTFIGFSFRHRRRFS